MPTNDIIHAYDAHGKPLGVFIPFAIWEQLAPSVKQALSPAPPKPQKVKEPVADWEMLVSNWDFPYPVDTDVHCQNCDTQTADWNTDNPRKFHLKAANLGGLVSFECCQCNARIRKNHFKDCIDVSCTPPTSR